jgi:hypothetical protein
MKNLKFLLMTLVVASLSLTSCSEDDGESGTSADIVGRWNPVRTVVSFNGNEIEQTYEHNEITCGKDYVDFAANEDFNNVVYFMDADDDCQTSAATVTSYEKSGDMLSIASGFYSGDYTITLLTSTDLQFIEGGGAAEATTTYYFSRAANQ